jgi:hypothetical protein
MTLAAAGNYLQARQLRIQPVCWQLYINPSYSPPEFHTTLRVQEFLLLLIPFVNCTDKSVQQLVGLFLRISAIRKDCIPSS